MNLTSQDLVAILEDDTLSQQLVYLKSLDLSNNQITEISESALDRLNDLINFKLYIIGNPLDTATINNLQAIGIINAYTQGQQEYEDTLSQGDNLETLANPTKEMAKQDNNLVICNTTAEDAVKYFVPANNIIPITSESAQTFSLSL